MPAPTFVIVRHGNTFTAGEPPRRIGSRTDIPLTTEGIAQGHALGSHFAALGWHYSRVLVSPLIRTRETARAILEHLPNAPEPEPCAWLCELDHGPDEDMPEDAVIARIGAEALNAWDTQGIAPPDWATDAEKRLEAWDNLLANDDGPTLLVTSNGAARFALLAIEQAAFSGQAASAGMKLPTGSYGVIRRTSEGTLDVPVWGKRP